MPTVYLKDGTKVEVPVEELADYLSQNRENIQQQNLKRRGPVRREPIAPEKPAA